MSTRRSNPASGRGGNASTGASGETRITDAGDLRRYRTEIPNLVDDLPLSIYARGLYQHIKRRAGGSEGGVCHAGTASMATALGVSAGMVSKAKQELAAAGLIEIHRQEGPTCTPDHITIVDVWPANIAYCSDLRAKRTANKTAADYLHEWRESQLAIAEDEGQKADAEKEVEAGGTPSPDEDPLHTVNTPLHGVKTPPSPHEDPPSPGETKNKPTKKEPIEEKAAAYAGAQTSAQVREEVPSSAAAAAASLPTVGEENNPTVSGSSGQTEPIMPRGIIPAAAPLETVPAGLPADAVPPPVPAPVSASASAIVAAGLTLDAFEPMPWGKGYDAFRAAFPADAAAFDREIADRAGTDRAIRKPPEVYFRQRIIETLRGERSSAASSDRASASAMPSATGAASPIPISTSLAQILALQRADREKQSAAASTAPEGARPQ